MPPTQVFYRFYKEFSMKGKKRSNPSKIVYISKKVVAMEKVNNPETDAEVDSKVSNLDAEKKLKHALQEEALLNRGTIMGGRIGGALAAVNAFNPQRPKFENKIGVYRDVLSNSVIITIHTRHSEEEQWYPSQQMPLNGDMAKELYIALSQLYRISHPSLSEQSQKANIEVTPQD